MLAAWNVVDVPGDVKMYVVMVCSLMWRLAYTIDMIIYLYKKDIEESIAWGLEGPAGGNLKGVAASDAPLTPIWEF